DGAVAGPQLDSAVVAEPREERARPVADRAAAVVVIPRRIGIHGQRRALADVEHQPLCRSRGDDGREAGQAEEHGGQAGAGSPAVAHRNAVPRVQRPTNTRRPLLAATPGIAVPNGSSTPACAVSETPTSACALGTRSATAAVPRTSLFASAVTAPG